MCHVKMYKKIIIAGPNGIEVLLKWCYFSSSKMCREARYDR